LDTTSPIGFRIEVDLWLNHRGDAKIAAGENHDIAPGSDGDSRLDLSSLCPRKNQNMSNKKFIVYILDDVLLVCADCITDKERIRLRKEHTLVAEEAKAYEDNFCIRCQRRFGELFPD
jgi:hypothetical protein